MDEKAQQSAFSKYTDEELQKIKKFAFMPTGIFGVHDFMLGQTAKGILHIIISVSCFVFCNDFGEMICKNVGNCRTASEIDTFYGTMVILGVIFLIGSWFWAFFEGDEVGRLTIERHKTPQQKLIEKEEEKIQRKRNVMATKRAFSNLSETIGIILVVGDLIAVPLAMTILGPVAGFFLYIIAPSLSVLAIFCGIVGVIGKGEDGKFRHSAITGLILGILGGAFALLFIRFVSGGL